MLIHAYTNVRVPAFVKMQLFGHILLSIHFLCIFLSYVYRIDMSCTCIDYVHAQIHTYIRIYAEMPQVRERIGIHTHTHMCVYVFTMYIHL